MYGPILPLLPMLPPNPQLAVLSSSDWSGWFDDDRLAAEVWQRALRLGHISDRDLNRMLIDPAEPRLGPFELGGRQSVVFLNTPGLFIFTRPARWSAASNFADLFGAGDNGGGFGSGGIGRGGDYVRAINITMPASGTMEYFVGSSNGSTAATWFIGSSLYAAACGNGNAAPNTSFGSFINPGGLPNPIGVATAGQVSGGGGAGGPSGGGFGTTSQSSYNGGAGGAGFGGAGGTQGHDGSSGAEFGTYGSGGGGGGSNSSGGNGGLYGGGGGWAGSGIGGQGAQGLIVLFNGSNITSQVTIL